jgi:hypothetical protein
MAIAGSSPAGLQESPSVDEARLLKANRIWRGIAVLAGAFLMAWPALYNGYPLVYPDSMSYLEGGHRIARALFLHRFSASYGGRSLIYSLGILPLHWNVTPWPIVAFNALLTAYVLWLVARSILPRQTIISFFVVVLTLSALTGLGWFVSLVMPDIFGPLLYLCIYLLAFAEESLSRAERVIVVLIAWWSVASHITHFMLAAGLCAFLALPLLRRWLAALPRLRMIGLVAIVVGTAAAASLALHTYLEGEPSLTGRRPPFLMARVLADGPGKEYLSQHCPDAKLVVCGYLNRLPSDSDDFLWDLDGIWMTASPATQEDLRREEMPLVLATVRAYPGEELRISAAHFWGQLLTFGLWDYDRNAWVEQVFDRVLPGALQRYLRTREARGEMPEELSSTVQQWTVIASLALIGVFAPLVLRRRARLIGLSAVVIFVIIANAFVTGVFSTVDDRYQARVVWLLPMLATLFVLHWIENRRSPQPERPTIRAVAAHKKNRRSREVAAPSCTLPMNVPLVGKTVGSILPWRSSLVRPLLGR